jgi:hypothetical protein
MPSPWQGAGYLANTFADALGAKRADQAAGQRRQDLAGYITRAGDNPTAADIGQITAADPELGRTYLQEIQQRRSQAAQIQAQKEMAAQKAQQDMEYLQKQDTLSQAHPQTDVGKIKQDLSSGRISQEEADAAIKKATAGSPAEQKLTEELQSKNIDLQASGQGLDEALKLLETGKVYSDSGLAGLRTEHGQSVPKALQGIAGVDPESTDISKRYSQLMKVQVLPILNKLKGSMSNADREWAIATIDNPSSTIEAKKDVIRMLKVRMDAELKQSNLNLKNTGATAVQVEQPAIKGAAAPAAASPAAAAGGDPKEKARAAIAAGAPRDKVIERLKQAGIDPAGL